MAENALLENMLKNIMEEQVNARNRAEASAVLVSRIDAKMTALVGTEGNGGTLGSLEERIVSLERFRWMGSGAAFLAGVMFALVKYLWPSAPK